MLEPDADDAPGRGRAIWSGTITFGLVSVPVDLFTAIRARQTSMRLVDPKGKPLGRQYYCPTDGKALSADEIVRGYEMDDGKMVVVTDEELASVAPEMSRDIDLRRFVPLEQIPPTYFQRPYILAPAGRSTKAYHLLAETMQRSGKVGIGTFVMRGHEYLVAILSEGDLLRAETLRFPDELRTPAEVGLPARAKPPAKRVTEFRAAIDALTRDSLDPAELSDRYAEALHHLVEDKEKHHKDVVGITALEGEAAEPAGADVIDLVQLLRERLSPNATVTTAEHASGAAVPQGARGERAPPKRAPAGRGRSRSARAAADDLAALSKAELQKRAQALHIAGRTKLDKAALIQAIRQAG